MNDAQFQNYLKGQGAAATTAMSKQSIAQLQAGNIKKYLPTGDGRYAAIDGKGNIDHIVDGTVDPAFLNRVSTTQQWLSDGAGGFISAPKTTVSGPALSPQQKLQLNVPALGAPQAQPPASGFPKSGGAAQPSAGGRAIYTKEPVFAFDPSTQERVLTTPAEAAQKGWTNPVKVKEGDIDKYRTATVQFNDIQSNLSRYTKAATDYSNSRAPLTRNGVAVSPQNPVEVSGFGSFVGMPSHITNSDDMRVKDNDNLQTLMNKAGWADMQASISAGGHITVPMLTAMGEKLSRSVNSKAYNELSDQGKALMDGYIRTLAAVPAYQKALTGVGRLNKEAMELEMANIPNPTMAPNDQLRKLQAFQENVDQGAAGIPRLPGVPTLKETRARFEGTGQGLASGFQIPKPF